MKKFITICMCLLVLLGLIGCKTQKGSIGIHHKRKNRHHQVSNRQHPQGDHQAGEPDHANVF